MVLRLRYSRATAVLAACDIVVLLSMSGCFRKHAADDEFADGSVREDCNGFDRAGSQMAADFTVKCIEAGSAKDDAVVYRCGERAREMFCLRESSIYVGKVSKPCRLTVGKARDACLAAGWTPALPPASRKETDTTLPTVAR